MSIELLQRMALACQQTWHTYVIRTAREKNGVLCHRKHIYACSYYTLINWLSLCQSHLLPGVMSSHVSWTHRARVEQPWGGVSPGLWVVASGVGGAGLGHESAQVQSRMADPLSLLLAWGCFTLAQTAAGLVTAFTVLSAR